MDILGREQFVEFHQFRGGPLDLKGGEIFFEMTLSPGSRDRENIVPLLQNPGKRKLGRGALFSLGKVFKSTDEREILFEIVRLESRQRSPKIVALQLKAVECSREYSPAQGAKCDKANSELMAQGH